MARSSRKSSAKRSGGITIFGVLVGLILGLAAAVAVALFVTQVPMPFADKASRDPATVLLPDVRDAPDPNRALFGSQSSGPTDTTIQPPATGKPQPDAQQNSIDQLIATLSPDASSGNGAPASPAAPAAPAPPAATPPRPAPGTESPAAGQTTYALQAGAFRSQADAQAMQARVLLLGLPVSIQQAQVNGGTLYRVRVGPFKGIDEMNRARARLGEEKIESSVVRP